MQSQRFVDNADRVRRPPHETSVLELDVVIERYGRLVAAAVRRVVGPSGDVDDQVQETWIAYLRSGHQVSDAAALGGWLFRVATRLAVRSQQRAARAVPHADLERLCERADHADPETDLFWAQRRGAVVHATAELRDREQQMVALLLDDADLGYREISARLGVPIGSLGPTRERVIRKIRSMPAVRRLADDGGDGSEPVYADVRRAS